MDLHYCDFKLKSRQSTKFDILDSLRRMAVMIFSGFSVNLDCCRIEMDANV